MQSFWMVGAAFFFSAMAVGIKYASVAYGTADILLYRGLVSIVFMGVVMRSRGVTLATPVPLMHVWRNIVGVTAMACWFYAIAHLPLATAMTLNYMSGVWVAAIVLGGALLYGNASRQGPLLLAVLISFVGVVLILRPSLDQNQLHAGLIGLLSGLCAAFAVLQVAAIGRAGEPESRTVFYFSVGTTLAGALGLVFGGMTSLREAPWQATVWLVPIGVLASLGQWCLTRAYSRGTTLLVANLQYTGIIFSLLYGLLLFGDHIDPTSWAGMLLIVISGVAATTLRARALPNAPIADR